MKKLALTFVMTLFLAACSSGTSVSDVPINVTGNYTGTYKNLEDTDDGTVILNLVEDGGGSFSGIAQFIDNDCLLNSVIQSGTRVGFNIQIVLQEATLQLNSDNAGNLSGTYTYTSGDGQCSNSSGSGSLSVSLN
jgi:hypothetical protein